MLGGIIIPIFQITKLSWTEARSLVHGHTGDQLACQGCLASKPCSVAAPRTTRPWPWVRGSNTRFWLFRA